MVIHENNASIPSSLKTVNRPNQSIARGRGVIEIRKEKKGERKRGTRREQHNSKRDIQFIVKEFFVSICT